jgi:hypothetical protein
VFEIAYLSSLFGSREFVVVPIFHSTSLSIAT